MLDTTYDVTNFPRTILLSRAQSLSIQKPEIYETFSFEIIQKQIVAKVFMSKIMKTNRRTAPQFPQYETFGP